MISPDDAQTFAREWVKAWNDHDLEAILAHYADDVVFHSPRIRIVTGRDVDALNGRAALRDYWGRALDLARDLYFEVDQVFTSSDALTTSTPTTASNRSRRLSCWGRMARWSGLSLPTRDRRQSWFPREHSRASWMRRSPTPSRWSGTAPAAGCARR